MEVILDEIIDKNKVAALKSNNITHIFHHSIYNWCFI